MPQEGYLELGKRIFSENDKFLKVFRQIKLKNMDVTIRSIVRHYSNNEEVTSLR